MKSEGEEARGPSEDEVSGVCEESDISPSADGGTGGIVLVLHKGQEIGARSSGKIGVKPPKSNWKQFR
jgi:hypothetical protein